MNIQLLMMIYWSPKRLHKLHPQELGHGRMKGSSNHLGELARNGSWLHEMLCL